MWITPAASWTALSLSWGFAAPSSGPTRCAGAGSNRCAFEAITSAGGLHPDHGRQVHVVRQATNGLSDQVSISLDDILVKADPRVNIPIFPGDLINVPKATSVTVYCLGEVSSPGAQVFTSNERVTVRNLQVAKVDADQNLLFIRGSVPGHADGIVCIRSAVQAE